MKWHLNIKSETKNIDIVRTFLWNIFCECEYNLELFNRVFLGVSEAVCNSIEHGNKRIEEKNVLIQVFDCKDYIVIEVKDEGVGFDFDNLPDPIKEINIRGESGRGIFILKNIADEVAFLENGTKIMIKFLMK